jgi:hypothetical protein
MIGNAINAQGEALELHELASEELDRVSGGEGMIWSIIPIGSTFLNQNPLFKLRPENEPKRVGSIGP